MRPPPRDGWLPYQLILNRRLTLPSTGEVRPPEFQDTGALRQGSWDPDDPTYDRRNTWQVVDGEIRARIPWAMLGLADPSSRTVLLPTPGGPEGVVADRLGVTVDVAGQRAAQGAISWDPWNAVSYAQRLKAGAPELARMFRETAP